MTSPPVAALIDQLDLERIGPTTFLGRTGDPLGGPYARLFGGLIAAQSLRAAQASVPADRHAHSLHGYFLAPGKTGDPVELDVDPLRDGRSFNTRRVVVRQGDQPIFTLVVSFHRDEPGREFQVDAPDAPDPDTGTPWIPGYPPAEVFEFREVPLADDRGPDPATMRFWARTRAPLPDDRGLHLCVLAYLSDLSGLTASARAIGLEWGAMQAASLDHTVHFHRPLRLDRWVLVDMRPVSNSGSRGLVRNTIHDREGVLGASVTQEALVREISRRR
jgi:acyl-CoA thioesterase-2